MSEEVVFLPPIALDADSIRWLDVPDLRCIAFPGFDRGQQYPSLIDMAQSVAESIAPGSHVIGCSMGGMVAMRLALDHPELVGSLVLGYTSARVEPRLVLRRAEVVERRGAVATADETMRRWFTPAALVEEEARPPVGYARARLEAVSTPLLASGWRAIAANDALDELENLRIPVTCIAGARDESNPMAALEAITARAPHARMMVLDHPHMGFLEDPAGFSEIVRDHIVRVRSDHDG